MKTITLSYDGRNKTAKAVIKFIETLGIFTILYDTEPNETTKQAINDAHNGNTYKSKNLEDMYAYLKS